MPLPTPSGNMNMPPRPPFGGIGGGIGGIGGLGSLKSSRSKPSKFVETPFNEETILGHWKMSAIERMRKLDSARKHTPTQEECDLLNVTDRRLDAHSFKELLSLCGGNKGGRFNTEDLSSLQKAAKLLETLWEGVQSTFEYIDKDAQKIVLSRDYNIPAEFEKETISVLLEELEVDKEPVNRKEIFKQLREKVTARAAGELPEEEVSEVVEYSRAIKYHQLADSYLRVLHTVKLVATRKQIELTENQIQVAKDETEAEAQREKEREEEGDGDGDGERRESVISGSSKRSASSSSSSQSSQAQSHAQTPTESDESMGSIYPSWLKCLIDKFEKEIVPVIVLSLAIVSAKDDVGYERGLVTERQQKENEKEGDTIDTNIHTTNEDIDVDSADAIEQKEKDIYVFSEKYYEERIQYFSERVSNRANTVGKFAAFLSGGLTGEITFTIDEKMALWSVLQASNDSQFVVDNKMVMADVMRVVKSPISIPIPVAGAGAEAKAGEIETEIEIDTVRGQGQGVGGQGVGGGEGHSHLQLDRTYWTQRFFKFLSKMTELRARPKDERSMLEFHLLVPEPAAVGTGTGTGAPEK